MKRWRHWTKTLKSYYSIRKVKYFISILLPNFDNSNTPNRKKLSFELAENSPDMTNELRADYIDTFQKQKDVIKEEIENDPEENLKESYY